jgi:hypothetical protein
LIEIPDGLFASDEPYVPDVQRLYRLYPPLLDPNDPKPTRPAVVVRADADIVVVTRSASAKKGVFHANSPAGGLTKDGRFSRVRSVSALLWTPKVAKSLDLVLDDATFKLVCEEFGL